MFATAATNNGLDPPVRMTIDKNGNCGIGTTSTTNPFTLNKPGTSIIGNWYNLGSFIEPTNNKGIHLGYDNSSQTGLIISGSNGPASNLAFWTWNGSDWGERMRVASSGNVGIGTTSPELRLDARVANTTTDFTNNVTYAGAFGNVSGKRVTIGYDETGEDVGVIQSVYTGVGFKNLSLNPNGGNVGIGTINPTSK